MTVRMKFSTILSTAPPMRQQNPSMQNQAFRALLRGILDKRFFLFRLTKIYA